MAVMIHGGGWENGSRDDVVSFVPNLTSRQYVVANIGYRLSAEARAPAAAEDVRNAVESIRSQAPQWNADATRILLVGFSAGAHLALLSALAPSGTIGGPQSHPRAIVSFWGPTDLTDLLERNHPRDFALARDFVLNWFAGTIQHRELAERLSPINYDAAEAPALCAVHSVYDDVVPYAHSERLVKKFRERKKLATLIKRFHQGHAAASEDYAGIFDELFHFLNGARVME